MSENHSFFSRIARRSEGAAAVEFVLILNLLLLLILGMMDFGHAWFLKQIITNASREGARYGAMYTSPKKTTSDIQTHVLDYMKSAGMSDATTSNVAVTGSGGTTGTPLTVTVLYQRAWWVVHHFVPILGDKADLKAQTVMRNE